MQRLVRANTLPLRRGSQKLVSTGDLGHGHNAALDAAARGVLPSERTVGHARTLLQMEEEFDWGTAVHEAGHAVVGLKLGWDVDWVSAAPSMTHFNQSGQETVSEAMSMAAAGTLAELISAGKPADDAFDEAIRVFYERLGDEDVMSQTARGLVASSPAEDLHNLVVAIEQHATREEGIEQFRAARAAAIDLLVKNWDLTKRLAYALQRDPSGKSSEVAELLTEARSSIE